MRVYQQLSIPQIVELREEVGFILVTEIDLTQIKNNIIFMKGKAYSYEDGEAVKGNMKEIQYSVSEDNYSDL